MSWIFLIPKMFVVIAFYENAAIGTHITDPHILVIIGDEEYLILGCDGLWDTIQPPDVIAMVQEHLTGGGSRSQVAKFLVERAISHGSTDNITVVVVFLDCHRTPSKEPPESSAAMDKEGTGEEEAPETTASADTTEETGDEKAGESMETEK